MERETEKRESLIGGKEAVGLIERGGGRGRLEKKEERKRKEKKRIFIKIILFNSAQKSTSSKRCQKITKNREFYPEM